MLKSIFLLTVFAGTTVTPPQSVLVLRSGQAMRVLSYEVSDSLVLVRSLEDEKLSIRKDRIDLERSAELTRQLRERLQRAEEQKELKKVTEPTASPTPKTAKRAAHKPNERWRAGSLSTMSSGDEPSDNPLEELKATLAAEDAAYGKPDTTEEKQYWQTEYAKHAKRVRGAQKKVDQVSEDYRRARSNAELTGYGWKTAFRLERELESVTQDFDRTIDAAREFLERARREKVPRGWLR